jgi:hypothetical protein
MFDDKDDTDVNYGNQITTDDTNINNLSCSGVMPEKKKRGRKPKNQQTQNTNQNQIRQSSEVTSGEIVGVDENDGVDRTNNLNENNTENINNVTIKKRGRKANTKIFSLIQPENNNVEMVTNLIACLPLRMSDISKILADPNIESQTDTNKIEDKPINNIIPNRYVELMDDSFNDFHHNKMKQTCGICTKCISNEDKIKKLEEEILNLKNGIMDNTTNFNKKIFESKVNFMDRSSNEWNEKTDIACWWCCHKFDHIPIGIPEFINKDKFYLFGCFCSFNCMMSYNLDLNDYKIWDRQANIYQMKNRIDPFNKITIHPAPPRQTLQMFGGPLSIRDFRESFFVLNKEFRCFFPPMISIIGIIEEDNRDLTGGIKIKHNKISDEPIIKRKTQLQKHKNTLHSIVTKS